MKRGTKISLAAGIGAAILAIAAPMSSAAGIHKTGCDEDGFTKFTYSPVVKMCFADAGTMDVPEHEPEDEGLMYIDSGDNKITVKGVAYNLDTKKESDAEYTLEKHQTWRFNDKENLGIDFEPTSLTIH